MAPLRGRSIQQRWLHSEAEVRILWASPQNEDWDPSPGYSRGHSLQSPTPYSWEEVGYFSQDGKEDGWFGTRKSGLEVTCSEVAGPRRDAVFQRQFLSEGSSPDALEKHSPFAPAQPCGMLLRDGPHV